MKQGMLIIFLLLFSLTIRSEPAPRFSLKTPEKEEIVLDSLIGKGPILLAFWATWCRPCVAELDQLRTFHEEYREQGLQFLAVSVDGPRSISRVMPFARSRHWEYSILLDPSGEVKKLYGVSSIPGTFLIDRDGNIAYTHRGYKRGDELNLKREIETLLNTSKEEEQ